MPLCADAVDVSYSAGVSACEKGGQWQRALALLSGMREAKLEPGTISYTPGIIACEKGEQWEQALSLLSEAEEAGCTDVTMYGAVTNACEKGGQWHRAVRLLDEV